MKEQEFIVRWGWDKNARCDKSDFRRALKSLLKQARIDELSEYKSRIKLLKISHHKEIDIDILLDSIKNRIEKLGETK